VSRRLADVATIFLPISFLVGFWGQNFNVLTGSIEEGGGWGCLCVLGGLGEGDLEGPLVGTAHDL
jgi:magnesium transporter